MQSKTKPKSSFNRHSDPAFRSERAREAARASWTADGVIRRFLNKLAELSPEQVETVRRALPPVPEDQGEVAE